MKSDASEPSTELALRPLDAPHFLDDVRLQGLWLAMQQREWQSIAVLGASAQVDTLPVAETLAKVAWWYRGQPSCVFDLRDISLRLIDYQLSEVDAQVVGGARVTIALRSIFENPTAIAVAKRADAVVLCIGLGRTDFKAVEQTIAQIGRERVLGTIVLRDGPRAKARRRNGR